MLTFSEKEELTLYEEQKYLEEKLIMLNQGKRHGQIVFMAGGAASGKGFAVKNFLEGDKFKIRDVDQLKVAFADLDRIQRTGKTKTGNPTKQKGFKTGKDLDKLDFSKGKDVFILHATIKNLGVSSKQLDLLLKDMSTNRKPNILFDVTAKSPDVLVDISTRLIELGYEKKNIHIVWVLTNYSVAVKANAERERVVPDDILLKTHEGAARTMFQIAKTGKMPAGIDGEFHVILNNHENTIFFEDTLQEKTIKSFSSIRLKKAGKAMEQGALQSQLHQWIKDNVPKTAFTAKEMDI